MAHLDQTGKRDKCIHRREWRPERELEAFGAAHPTWKRKQPATRRLAKEAFSFTMLLAPADRQSQTEKRMPTVVDRSVF